MKTGTCAAFEITEEDVEHVLRKHVLDVANTNGKSFESMANEIWPVLDHSAIEGAALYACELDLQTQHAHDEIANQLRALGILEPLKAVVHQAFTIGVCHYRQKKPYKWVVVEAESQLDAMKMAATLLKPSVFEHLVRVV